MPSSSGSAAPGWRERLVRADLLRRAWLLLLLALVSAAAALLLAPPGGDRLPGPEALGLPSPQTVKADRDYDVVDEEASARRRAAAATAVLPVYDQDDGADDEAAARIHAAFSLMRAVEAGAPEGGTAERLRRAAAQRDAFVARLQLLVRDDDFAALAAAEFSEAAERELATLTGLGLQGPVVADPALLPEAHDAGLTVRTLLAGVAVREREVTDRRVILDLAAAREVVARAAATRLGALPAPLRAALLRLGQAGVRPTLVHNQAETDRRRSEAEARVKAVVIPVKRGERIVAAGERLEPRQLAVLDAIRARRRGTDRGDVRLGAAALVALLLSVLWSFARRALPDFRPGRRQALLLALLFAGVVALAAQGDLLVELVLERAPLLPRGVATALLPLAAGALAARLLLPSAQALLLAVAAGLAAGLVGGPSFALALQAVVTSLAAAAPGGRGRGTAAAWRGGLASGLAGAAVAAGLGYLDGRSSADVLQVAGPAFFCGLVLVPLTALAAVKLAEALLGAVGEGRLRALASLNHPALKELIVQAPGTYHHSIVMGTLVESAARAIGADALLARVAAYYHDVGKITNPLLFAENQKGHNEHDELAPSMSALAVKRHVTDGLELARRWRLPRAVADVIPQHHGTRRVAYFWAKHQKLVEAGQAGPVDDAVFRYAGPRPRSREVALVMIADACEASARSLAHPDAAALRAVVAQRVAELTEEGQLDECDLTLRELAAATAAIEAALAAIYLKPEAARPPEGRPPVQLVAGP